MLDIAEPTQFGRQCFHGLGLVVAWPDDEGVREGIRRQHVDDFRQAFLGAHARQRLLPTDEADGLDAGVLTQLLVDLGNGARVRLKVHEYRDLCWRGHAGGQLRRVGQQ